jgi:hypothetical protein
VKADSVLYNGTAIAALPVGCALAALALASPVRFAAQRRSCQLLTYKPTAPISGRLIDPWAGGRREIHLYIIDGPSKFCEVDYSRVGPIHNSPRGDCYGKDDRPLELLAGNRLLGHHPDLEGSERPRIMAAREHHSGAPGHTIWYLSFFHASILFFVATIATASYAWFSSQKP